MKGNGNIYTYNIKGYCICTAIYALVLLRNDIMLLKYKLNNTKYILLVKWGTQTSYLYRLHLLALSVVSLSTYIRNYPQNKFSNERHDVTISAIFTFIFFIYLFIIIYLFTLKIILFCLFLPPPFLALSLFPYIGA